MTFKDDVTSIVKKLSQDTGISLDVSFVKMKSPYRNKFRYKLKLAEWYYLQSKNKPLSLNNNNLSFTKVPLHEIFNACIEQYPIKDVASTIKSHKIVFYGAPFNRTKFKPYDIWGQGKPCETKDDLVFLLHSLAPLFSYLGQLDHVLDIPKIKLVVHYMEIKDTQTLKEVTEENETRNKNFLKIRKVFKNQVKKFQNYPYTTTIQFMYVGKNDNKFKTVITGMIENIKSMYDDGSENVNVDISSESIRMLDTDEWAKNFKCYGNPTIRLYFKNIDDALMLFPFAENKNILSIKTEHKIGEIR